MKKHLLTAVLAIVAVGGSFAMNANTNEAKLAPYHYTVGGNCNQISTLPENCGSGPATCTVNGATLFDGACGSPDTNPIPFQP